MRKIVGIGCVIVLAVFCGFEIYHQTGMVHTTRKNGFGCICHGFDVTDSVRVWISGPDSLLAGQTGVFQVHVSKDSSIAAGFNVASSFGALGVIDSVGTQLITEAPGTDSLELTHKYPPRGASGSDTISWTFSYKAPENFGMVDTLFSAGNSVDLDTSPDGDYWNFGQEFLVRVVGTSSVTDVPLAGTFRLLQNYPNPFNPSTNIRYELPADGRVDLRVFDLTGREIAILIDQSQNAGMHEAIFAGGKYGELASGLYFYRMTFRPEVASSGKSYTSVKKMILMK